MHTKIAVVNITEVKLRPTVSWPVYLGVGHPSGARDQIFYIHISDWQLWVSCCMAPSLTREWVCNLLIQLLLGIDSARNSLYIYISHS
jgi:hypothetical protein